MEKILVFFVTLFFLINIANAEEYTPWVENKLLNNDNLEQQVRYRWYQEKIEGEYTLDNSNYLYTDYDNYLFGDYSNWQDDCTNIDINNYDIEYKNFYLYQEIIDTRYILFNDYNQDITINNISILINNKPIEFNIYDSYQCKSDNCDYHDNFVKIDMLNYYNMRDFKITINSTSESIGCFMMWMAKDKDFTTFGGVKNICNHFTSFTMKDHQLGKSMFSELKYSDIPIEKTFYNTLNGEKEMCRYRPKIRYHYNITKDYYDNNYYLEIDNYIKDNDDFKVYYRYLISDKKIHNNNLDTINTDYVLDDRNYLLFENDLDDSYMVFIYNTNPLEQEIEEELKETNTSKDRSNLIFNSQDEEKKKNNLINFLLVRKKMLIKNKFLVLGLSILLIILLIYKKLKNKSIT